MRLRPRHGETPRPEAPPLPDNPYRRFYTRPRCFEELARRRDLKPEPPERDPREKTGP